MIYVVDRGGRIFARLDSAKTLETELQTALAWWIGQYNEDYPHSAIGYQTPVQFEASFEPQPSTQTTLQIAA